MSIRLDIICRNSSQMFRESVYERRQKTCILILENWFDFRRAMVCECSVINGVL